MPEKLLTLRELSDYLHIKEKKLKTLVEEGAISAYRLGGELLRFRKDQIEAIRTEIESRVTDADRITGTGDVHEKNTGRDTRLSTRGVSSVWDTLADFFYFGDFYIVSGALIVVLLIVIFRG